MANDNPNEIDGSPVKLTEKTPGRHYLDFLVKVVLPAAVIIITMNLFFNPPPKDAKEKVQNAWMAGNRRPALTYLKKQVEENFFSLKRHRRYLTCQHELSSGSKSGDATDKAVQHDYTEYTKSTDPNISDIGFYGLGFFYSIRNEYPQALENFDKVGNRDLIFLNNSIGRVYQKMLKPEKAKPYFLREIELNGNTEGAYYNLSLLYFEARDFEAIDELLANEDARACVPSRIIRYVDLHHGRLLSYLKDALSMEYTTFTGSLSALFILIIWFQYLRKLDVFEPERVRFLLLTLFGGMVFSMGCAFLYDFYDYGLRFDTNGNILNDLFYCIVGIGLIEETVKFIPFLLVLKFTKQVNESIDYIIYAAVSALGFAFMENLIYFQDFGLKSISGRCLSAVLMHMSLTTCVAYGLFYAKYKNKNHLRLWYLVLSFTAACVVHGLYDFWLIADIDPQFKIFSVLILIYCILIFSNMIINALNQSEFNPDRKRKIEGLSKYLVYSLSYVFLLQYVVLAWKFGASNANQRILRSILSAYLMLLVIFGSLGKIEVNRGQWIPPFKSSSA